MPYCAYVQLYEGGLSGGFLSLDTSASARAEAIWAQRYPDVAAPLLPAPTASVRDGPFADGSHPLVLYAPGYGASPLSHTALCEYLARHGYVVAASPSLGEGAVGITFDSSGPLGQARDPEFVLGVLSTEEMIDLDRIGAVGFGFGGSAALLAAMRDARIGAVESLDGGVGFQLVLALTRWTEGFAAARVRAPLLHLRGADAPWRDLSLVEGLRLADRFWVDLSGGEHLDFISAPSMRRAVGMSVPASRLAHFQTVAKVLLAFLESSLDTPALAAPAIRSALDGRPLPREAFRFTAMPRTADVPTGYEFRRAMAEPRTTLGAIEAIALRVQTRRAFRSWPVAASTARRVRCSRSKHRSRWR